MQIRSKVEVAGGKRAVESLFSAGWPWVRSLEEAGLPQRGLWTGRRCYVSAWPGSLCRNTSAAYFRSTNTEEATRGVSEGFCLLRKCLFWWDGLIKIPTSWDAVAFCGGNKIRSSLWRRWIFFLWLASEPWMWIRGFKSQLIRFLCAGDKSCRAALWGEFVAMPGKACHWLPSQHCDGSQCTTARFFSLTQLAWLTSYFLK